MEVRYRVPDPSFWRGRKVFLTGHTGFKGAWASAWLAELGAEVVGLSLPAQHEFSIFTRANIEENMVSVTGDIRGASNIESVFDNFQPEIVVHMAAQALVRPAVENPIQTIETNIVGTANLLNSLRKVNPKVILNITSDKVYKNNENAVPCREGDFLGGDDPYSASKAGCELITTAFAKTYFSNSETRIATARGGNVIGGGDEAQERIVPDVIRAIRKNCPVQLRMPNAIRPWQHVLDCVGGYLVYIEDLYSNKNIPESMNIGPNYEKPLTVGELASSIYSGFGLEQTFEYISDEQTVEKNLLYIDPSRAKEILGWESVLSMKSMIGWTIDWYKEAQISKKSARNITLKQIKNYQEQLGN